MKVKISIVVPIYNVEAYLEKCVESILAQTLREIEIILIDDGSTDGCAKIVDDLAARDDRIVAIHQNNSGYGAVVNRGINLARGEYVGIIESDDWVEPEMFEKLYMDATTHKTDITKGMFWKTDTTRPDDEQDVVFTDPGEVNLELAPSGAFDISGWPALLAFHASIWSAIYRREFLESLVTDDKLLTETAGAAYQDFPFAMKVLCAAEAITVMKEPFVHWRNDPNQKHSTSVTDKKAIQMITACETGVEIVKKSGKFEAVKEALYIHILWTNLGFLYNIDSKYEKIYWEKLREILSPVKTDASFKYSYFRKTDKLLLAIILAPNWMVAKTGLSLLRWRYKIKMRSQS